MILNHEPRDAIESDENIDRSAQVFQIKKKKENLKKKVYASFCVFALLVVRKNSLFLYNKPSCVIRTVYKVA